MCEFEAAAHPDVLQRVSGEGRAALDELHNAVTSALATGRNSETIIEALRTPFAAFLARPGWLPDDCRQPIPGKAASYMLLRSKEPEYVLFSMVLPAGESTKIHNHLTWGLIGLWQGRQYETQYHRLDDASRPEYAELRKTASQTLEVGQITRLLPPLDDTHQITTLSAEPSISIHLLGNDLGRIARQFFYPEEHRAETFVSGYDNVTGIEGADAAGVGARR